MQQYSGGWNNTSRNFSYPTGYHYQTAQQPQYSGTTSGQYGKSNLHMQNHECGSYNAKYRLDDAKYRLDDGFEMSTGFRSPRKPMF